MAIVRTADERDLALIARDGVQAVIFVPEALPPWLGVVGEAVRGGSLQVPRTVLDDVTRDGIEAWLAANVPVGALRDDVLSLVERTRELTGATRFQFRVMTAVPSRHCGFHVDTVPAAAPVQGLLRVYNGNGTVYVDPENIVSMREFYRYLSRRERLIRDVADAERREDGEAVRAAWAAVAAHDEERAFLHRPADVHVAPAGSIVAFRHLDVRQHWSAHSPELAWVHCSPMEGEARFLVNVLARRTEVRKA